MTKMLISFCKSLPDQYQALLEYWREKRKEKMEEEEEEEEDSEMEGKLLCLFLLTLPHSFTCFHRLQCITINHNYNVAFSELPADLEWS